MGGNGEIARSLPLNEIKARYLHADCGQIFTLTYSLSSTAFWCKAADVGTHFYGPEGPTDISRGCNPRKPFKYKIAS